MILHEDGISCQLPAYSSECCLQAGGGSSQQGSHHGSDLALAEVVEYLGSTSGVEPHVFRPGWEDIFRMNQKQLEVSS